MTALEILHDALTIVREIDTSNPNVKEDASMKLKTLLMTATSLSDEKQALLLENAMFHLEEIINSHFKIRFKV